MCVETGVTSHTTLETSLPAIRLNGISVFLFSSQCMPAEEKKCPLLRGHAQAVNETNHSFVCERMCVCVCQCVCESEREKERECLSMCVGGYGYFILQ